MLLEDPNHPVHIPAKPDKFEFDTEVASIFPNMAERSIPNYKLFHNLHAETVARWFARDGAALLDVGASHGAFFSALKHFYAEHPLNEAMPNMALFAVDNSEAMCGYMRELHNDAHVTCGDITDGTTLELLRDTMKFDVINATYVIQFLPVDKQRPALDLLASMLRPGGVLILGQKEQVDGPLGVMLGEMYIRWRESNGYSRAEIEAKTKALAGSMWPMYQDDLHLALGRNFRHVQETTRHLMFSTLIAYK